MYSVNGTAKFDYFLDYDFDLVDAFHGELKNGSALIKNGKIHFRSMFGFDTPWVHTKFFEDRDCYYYLSILFPNYNIIPAECHKCWKVVVRPRTVKELIKLYELQQKLDIPSKCGLEKRTTVHAPYGGYFYNKSLEEGQDCCKLVKKEVSENISPDIKVFLKRGCTEYELKFGDSDKWKLTDQQVELEKHISERVVYPIDNGEQPEFAKLNVMRRWIQYAYDRGDETYKEYTGGEPLAKPYVDYTPEQEI
jgi:hypothetical protein